MDSAATTFLGGSRTRFCGYKCLVPDQRGFGLSADNPNGSGPPAFVYGLEAVLNTLNVGQAAIVGYSIVGG